MSKPYSLAELREMKSNTDLERFKNTTERDIMEQSMSDPDLSNLTDDELSEFTSPEERRQQDERSKEK